MTKDALQHFPPGSEQFICSPSHAKPGIHPFPDKLCVVTMLENPLRWRSRYANYHAFAQHVQAAGAILYTAEIAFGERPFEVTEPGNPQQLQLRTTSELWHKENALNLMMQRLPSDAGYIAWIDADVTFARPDWAQETLHLLQHYAVLQMFSHAQDMGPQSEPLTVTPSYVSVKLAGPPPHVPKPPDPPPSYGYGYGYAGGAQPGWMFSHPGFAWAATKSALNSLGGLIDWAVLGSADWSMATALFGEVQRSLYPGWSKNYINWCLEWQGRADRYIRRNVGFMPGTVLHSWHGRKANRMYDNRWRFLAQTGFDPVLDLKRDTQGLWQLTDRSIALRDGLRDYARLRDEDSTAV